jgi:hypothetical protein
VSPSDIITPVKEKLIAQALSRFSGGEVAEKNLKTLKNNLEHVFGDEAYRYVGTLQLSDDNIEKFLQFKIEMNILMLSVPKMVENFLEHGLEGHKYDNDIDDFLKKCQKNEAFDLSDDQRDLYDKFKKARLKYNNLPEYEVANIEIRKMVDKQTVEYADIDVLKACAYKTTQMVAAQIGSSYISTKEYVLNPLNKEYVDQNDIYELEYMYATFIVNILNIFKILQKVLGN